MQTLSAFVKGIDWAKSGLFTQQDIDEAKLSVFSAVDAPVAPADKGQNRFLSDLDPGAVGSDSTVVSVLQEWVGSSAASRTT